MPSSGFGGGAGGGAGIFSQLTDFIKSKAFVQMLGAAGADLLGGTGGTNTNAAIQQNVASQNYMKLLSQMLGGKIPDGGKMTMDSTGMKIHVPNLAGSQVAGQSTGGNEGANDLSGQGLKGSGVIDTDILSKLTGGALNPFAFSQPGSFKPSDLAGVSPELITHAFNLHQNQQQIMQKSISDTADIIYKQGLLQKYQSEDEIARAGVGLRAGELGVHQQNAQVNQQEANIKTIDLMRKIEADDSPAPYDLPGIGPVNGKQFRELDAGTKAYGYYAHESKLRGKPALSREEWENVTFSSNKKDYIEAKAGGYKKSFMDFILEKAKAGASVFNLGAELEKKSALSQLQGRDYFNNPDWTKDIDTHIKTEDTQDSISRKARALPGGYTQENLAKATAIEKGNAVETKITAGGGTVIGKSLTPDGKTVIWSIKWPEIKDSKGKIIKPSVVETKSYAVR